jgi:nitric oxide reductase large subunit
MLPLLACCAGLYLGLHFNILVLLPFTVLGAGAFIFSSWTSGQSVFDSASILLFPIISVQAGYMLGLTARETYGQVLARLNIGQSKRI